MRSASNALIAAAITAAALMSPHAAYATTVAPTLLTIDGVVTEFGFSGDPSAAFPFTAPWGRTDDLNVGAAFDPTDAADESTISNQLNGGTFSASDDVSLAFTAGSWIVVLLSAIAPR